jgi:molecular chaperone DnaJ
VNIPAGIEGGARIHMAGQGEVGPGGGPTGDLYIEVIEQPDPIFVRNGDTLHATLPLPMTAAALGATMELPTLTGKTTITIKPGTQSGTTLTLAGMGMPRLRGLGNGDLVVHVDVQTPTHLDDQQRELLVKLAGLRGEEKPSAAFDSTASGGLFGKLKDAFTGR